MFDGQRERQQRRRSKRDYDGRGAEARWLGPGAKTVAVIALLLAAAWYVRPLLDPPPSDLSLAEAASIGDYDGVARALRAGICADGVGGAHGMPLLLATQSRDARVVELLLRNGADPACATVAGFTPLMTASMEGNTLVVRLLLDAGADPNQLTHSPTTPLGAAAATGNAATMELLLARGADPRGCIGGAPGVFHEPPLMCAIRSSESAAIVERLIEAGADVNVVDDEGMTPLRVASDAGRADLVDLLLRHGARRAPLKLAQANAAPPPPHAS